MRNESQRLLLVRIRATNHNACYWCIHEITTLATGPHTLGKLVTGPHTGPHTLGTLVTGPHTGPHTLGTLATGPHTLAESRL